MLETARMQLIPATAELLRAEIEDKAAFATLLNSVIPHNWPPEILADALPWFLQQMEANPNLTGWLCWYGVAKSAGNAPAVLVASGGFRGLPEEETVEIGYSVLPQYHRQGYGTEMAAGLVRWALEQPGVQRVIAYVHRENTPSLRLLQRLGFVSIGEGAEPDHLRYERDAE